LEQTLSALTTRGRCLVLGGRGFIGSHLVDRLLEDGIPTRVLARRLPADADANAGYRTHELLEVVSGDFNNEIDLLNAMDDCDSCVHLISTTLPKSSNENMIYDVQTNLVGTVRLLHYAKKVGMTKVVFVSSGGAVYGDAQRPLIDEDHPTNPRSSYGITKLASEKYFLMFADATLSTTVLRLSNPYGPRQRTTINQGAIAVFLNRALKHQEIQIWGDGEVVRDYLYISDCVAAIAQALEYRGSERLFNIGSGTGQSLNEILHKIEDVLGHKIPVSYTEGRSVDVARNVLDVERARKHLGWSPKVGFAEGLAATADWYKAQKR
jgi:UDP-glucose 4-epimerase